MILRTTAKLNKNENKSKTPDDNDSATQMDMASQGESATEPLNGETGPPSSELPPSVTEIIQPEFDKVVKPNAETRKSVAELISSWNKNYNDSATQSKEKNKTNSQSSDTSNQQN